MNNENGVAGAYTGDLGRQTTLIPQQEDKPPILPKQYSFISSCFFLTHRALHLGVQVSALELCFSFISTIRRSIIQRYVECVSSET